MKLTTQRLKKLIREELNKITEASEESDMKKAESWWRKNERWKDAGEGEQEVEDNLIKACAKETGVPKEISKKALGNVRYDAEY